MKCAWKWVLLLAVAASPWLCYLSAPFLYDDLGMLAENPFLEDPANLGRVLTGRTLADPDVVNGRRPAVLATYFLDRALYGLQPAGWRATSLMLHLGCVALLMGLLWRLTKQRYLSAAAGLLFGLHPVLAEAVHAPGFRADVLCLFFSLAAIHCWLGARTRTAAGGVMGLVFLALALLGKETAVAVPLLLGTLMVLYPAQFPAERCVRVWRVGLPVMMAAGFFLMWMLLPTDLQGAGGSWNGESLRFPANLLSVPPLWTRTWRFLLVPWPLNVTPAFAPVDSVFSGRFLAGLGLLAACAWGAWRGRRSAPAAALGLAWMAVFFLPVSNLWPLLHPVADRYFYCIVPGFAVLAAWVMARPPHRFRSLGLAVVAAAYALLLVLRLSQWSSAEMLWSAAYARNPQSATACTWLGLLREEAGDIGGARSFYAAAVEANSQSFPAWLNWGILESKAGRREEAERLFRRAVKARPEDARGWYSLGVCLESQGRTEEAAEAAARADALSPL